ncbi:Uncharacterised protein [Vibrio cholerae]|nr:Uncharacterised protein [Vibrio cholerae]
MRRGLKMRLGEHTPQNRSVRLAANGHQYNSLIRLVWLSQHPV